MVSVYLLSDALLQHLPSYLGFSYLGRGVSLHGCSSKAQPLLLTLDERYLLTAALPDLQCRIAPLGPPAPAQPRLLGRGVGPPGQRPWPRSSGCSSPPPPLASAFQTHDLISYFIERRDSIRRSYLYFLTPNWQTLCIEILSPFPFQWRELSTPLPKLWTPSTFPEHFSNLLSLSSLIFNISISNSICSYSQHKLA